MIKLDLDIEPQILNENLVQKIPKSGTTPIARMISELVAEQLRIRCKNYVASGSLAWSSVKNVFNESYAWNEFTQPSSLAGLIAKGVVDLGDFNVAVRSKSSVQLEIVPPQYLKRQETLRIKDTQLKIGCRYDIRMRWLQLHAPTLQPALEILAANCQCPAENLVPRMNGIWDWALHFDCKVCGKSYFCNCFEKALKIRHAEAQQKKSRYSKEGWPRKFISLYDRAEFRSGICHLCRNVPSDLFYCSPMYGSNILVRYGPYIVRTSVEKQIPQREAENEIRDQLGIPRIGEQWISEVELLKIVQHIFPEEEVIHQATAKWLGRQRLDIFVPSLKLAVEYHGLQHFESVDHFGGEDGLLATQARDSRKASLCAEQGITLVYFSCDDRLTCESVESRIQNALTQRQKIQSKVNHVA